MSAEQESLEAYAAGVAAAKREAGEHRALSAEDRDWRERALELIERIPIGSTFDADHVWSLMPPTGSVNAMGPVFRIAARRRLIRRVDWRRSSRVAAGGHIVGVWERIES